MKQYETTIELIANSPPPPQGKRAPNRVTREFLCITSSGNCPIASHFVGTDCVPKKATIRLRPILLTSQLRPRRMECSIAARIKIRTLMEMYRLRPG